MVTRKKVIRYNTQSNTKKPSTNIKLRNNIVLGIVSLFMCILVAKASLLQVVKSDELVAKSNDRSLRTKVITPLRGVIYDRNFKELAVSTRSYSIWISPRDLIANNSLVNEKTKWVALAKVLKISYPKFLKNIKTICKKAPNSRFYYVARQKSQEVADYAKDLEIAGVSVSIEQRRFYPTTGASAHLVGYTDIDNNGLAGIEKMFNTELSGEKGALVYKQNNRAKQIEQISYTKPKEAQDIQLSIDKDLQSMIHTELVLAVKQNKAIAGSAVVIDVHTGEIMAMVSAPTFNPNNRQNVKINSTLDGSISKLFEPGSTVKPFVVLQALEQKKTHEDEVFNTQALRIGKYTIKDVAPRQHLNLSEIVEYSSNIGMSRLALRMSGDSLVNTYRTIGYGKVTGLGLYGEAKGFIKNVRRITDIDKANFSFGYGLMVTPVQIAKAYTILANYGEAKPISILKTTTQVHGKQLFSKTNTKKVVNMMEKVVQRAPLAKVPGYRVAIKTGTAKKNENGRYVNKYIAYTAGFAPVSNPQYVVVVVIDEPKNGKYYGGAVSAPVFSKIMEKTLLKNNIAMDDKLSLENRPVIAEADATKQKGQKTNRTVISKEKNKITKNNSSVSTKANQNNKKKNRTVVSKETNKIAKKNSSRMVKTNVVNQNNKKKNKTVINKEKSKIVKKNNAIIVKTEASNKNNKKKNKIVMNVAKNNTIAQR